jgi:hypothetical protein
MERRQADRRMAALKLGMKVRIQTVDPWVTERLELRQITQYQIWTDKHPRRVALWRIPDRVDPWASPPSFSSWDLVSGEFGEFLKSIPEDIIGVGSEDGYVWVGFDDARASIEPETVHQILDQMMTFLAKR